MEKLLSFSSNESLNHMNSSKDEKDFSSTASIKSKDSNSSTSGIVTTAFKRFFSKPQRNRTRSINSTTNEHLFLRSKKSDSGKVVDASEYNLGKSVKIKGGHLKNKITFRGLCIVQQLHQEQPFISDGLKRTDSTTSFQYSTETPTSSGIWVMKFNLNGTFLACGRNDGMIYIWKRNLSLHADPITKAASTSQIPSKNGIDVNNQGVEQKSVGYLEFEEPQTNSAHELLLFDTEFVPTPHRILKEHLFAITDLSWSVGDFLVSGSLDNTVRLWHLDHPTCLCVFQHSDCPSSLQFHPFYNDVFISGSLDGRIRLWNIKDRKLICWNEIQRDSITAVAFTKDGSTIIAGTLSGSCIFYDSSLKYNTQIQVTTKANCKVSGIEIIPGMNETEEKFLVTTMDSKVRLFNVRDKSLYRSYKGVELKNNRSWASFSRDGAYIIVASDERQVSIWDTLPLDANQQYSGVLSAVIHRHIDIAKASGQEKFVASNYNTTCAIFAPWETADPMIGTVLLVSDDHGHVYVYKNS